MTRRSLLLGIAAALRKEQLAGAHKLLTDAVAQGKVGTAVLFVKQGSTEVARGFGKARGAEEVFLLASITKPMTAMAAMRLVDQGKLSLAHPVQKYIPEFHGGERGKITLKHVLTHTSGLPDMLPENEALRKRNASLKAFVQGACKTPLLFSPGSELRYQSMGILLAAECVERITRMALRDYLRTEIFEPLGMNNTSLGLGPRRIPDTAQCEVPGGDNWNWNSPYWRNLGAPWGGAHAPASDVARLLGYFLKPVDGPLKVATAKMMVTRQADGPSRGFGIGWMVGSEGFGKGCSASTFGHSGSTGTVAWADPARDLTCVLLTTRPAEQSKATVLNPTCDAVSQAVG